MNRFPVQKKVRKPWRQFLDSLAPFRDDLHKYCCKLTGNVWEGEDLSQETYMKVFSLLGKTDEKLDNPRAYLIRTATNLWIDKMRRVGRELAWMELQSHEEENNSHDVSIQAELVSATRELMQNLHPQERAAIVLKDVFDMSLSETASMLKTTEGAVKSALKRGRDRIKRNKPAANFTVPSKALVERFLQALIANDLDTLELICSTNLKVELVGGAETDSFKQSKSFFGHAHMEMPSLDFGTKPNWKLVDYEGELLVLGYRTLNGVEGLNEVHRLEELDGVITRVRCYCFCPETLRVVANDLGSTAVQRRLGYRSPSMSDIPKLLLDYAWRKIFTKHR
ncbi:MAG: sigma-70 family RNA polymerase sigma factor [Pseudomonadales bacterium]|nr:sigma-70 family RNA polymerase sigma factor [Pseudomonadales bacterium]